MYEFGNSKYKKSLWNSQTLNIVTRKEREVLRKIRRDGRFKNFAHFAVNFTPYLPVLPNL